MGAVGRILRQNFRSLGKYLLHFKSNFFENFVGKWDVENGHVEQCD